MGVGLRLCSAAMAAPEIHALTPDYCLASCGDFFLQVYNRTPVEAVDHVIRLMGPFTATHKNPVCMVVVEASGPLPDAAARERLEELSRRYIPQARCIAYAYEGTGIRSAAVRSFMVMLMLVQSGGTDYVVKGTAAEALDWIATKCGEAGTARAAERASTVEYARRRLAEMTKAA